MAAGVAPTKPDKWGETVAMAQAKAKAEKPPNNNGSSPTHVPPSPKVSDKLNKTVLISASTWDAFLPPPSNSFKVGLSNTIHIDQSDIYTIFVCLPNGCFSHNTHLF